MSSLVTQVLARGEVTPDGALEAADEALASLQRACGGRVGGQLAVPELRSLVAKAREYELRLSRPFSAVGVEERFSGWVEIIPGHDEDDACLIELISCQGEPLGQVDEDAQSARIRRELNRALPEFAARLAPDQTVLTADAQSPDLADLADAMRAGLGRHWTDFVNFPGSLQDQPLHWRLLDGAACQVPGSNRPWTVWLEPLGMPSPGSNGFVLTLVSDIPAVDEVEPEDTGDETSLPVLTQELAAVLRQPINRIMASAETIQAKLAGPLPEIYSGYGSDMVSASEHLGALLEDVADLEIVEAADLAVQIETIDLAEAARQACAILGARAQERSITLVAPVAGESQLARGDYRRALQILINLIDNAVSYAPEESQVWVRLDADAGRAMVTVADQGRGLSEDEQKRVFDKFERLGRKDREGSGLGLYIASRLADAMHGSLTVESAPGQGARFTLNLPLAV